jgi:Flp pilus assembly protein TadD
MVAVALRPQNPLVHLILGNALDDKKDRDVDGAIVEYQKAIALDPNYALAHNNLGYSLSHQGDVDGAVLEFFKAIDCDPKLALAHSNLGTALKKKHDLPGAIAQLRMAVDCEPKLALAHSNLGTALIDNKDIAGAISELRMAVDLDPKNGFYHTNLGAALYANQDLDGAIVECRKAIEIDHGLALAQNALGTYLCARGQFAEALTHYHHAQELGAKDPQSAKQSAHLVQQCERLVELDAKLPAVLSGMEQPASAVKWAEYADVCQIKHLYGAAARLYREAIASQPELVASPANGLRYNAACAAALAGCGAGEDTAKLTDAERAGLRKQARDWLRADLDAWRALLDKDPAKVRSTVAEQMQHWQSDVDFKGARDADALGKLPEAERKEWQKLWVDVGDMLAKAQGKTAPARGSEGK